MASPEQRVRDAERAIKYYHDPTNAEKIRAKRKEWRKANSEAIRKSNAEWRKANPDKYRDIQARYRTRNPEKGLVHVERRRARKMNAPVNDFTAADWRAVLEDFNGACAYCLTSDIPLQQEHMTPLSRGGEHTRSNIVPACAPCNYKKGTRTILEVLAA